MRKSLQSMIYHHSHNNVLNKPVKSNMNPRTITISHFESIGFFFSLLFQGRVSPGPRSNSAIDLNAARRAQARALYGNLNRSKIISRE